MKYLTLWLEGPLQSWGFDSKFDVRSTFGFPTKSGVFGLLLSASGDSGSQETLLGRMQNAPMTAYSYRKKEFPVLLRDFHMVGNGYDLSDKWQSLHTTRTKKGTRPVGGGAKLTYRYYLQDCAFGVILELEDDLADKFDKALSEPVFDLYLGRKCCVPSDLIGRGCFTHQEEALLLLDNLAINKGLLQKKSAYETSEADEETIEINDVPLRFGIHKIYKERLINISEEETLAEKLTSGLNNDEQTDH